MLFALVIFAFRAPEDRWPKAKSVKKNISTQVVVWVSGVIEQEGRYHFTGGTTLREALIELEIKDFRCVDERRLDMPLKPGQRIKIKKINNPLVNN